MKGSSAVSNDIRVLIVEHHAASRCLAQRLIANYDLEFSWRYAQSAQELGEIAAAFGPAVVFCADEMPQEARCAALDMLHLLSPGSANVMVVEVGEAPAGPLLAEPPSAQVLGAMSADEPQPGPWRHCLPSILAAGRDAVALADAAGWITYANIQACCMLGASNERLLGTLLGDAGEFPLQQRPRRLAFFDACSALPTPVHASELAARALAFARGDYKSLPVVALNLQGLRLMNETRGRALGDKVLDIVCSELRSGAADCGMVAPLSANDVLIVLPPPSHPADAVLSVRAGRSELAAPAVAAAPVAAANDEHPFQPSAAVAAQTLRSPVEAGLDQALRRHAIGVHYQPQFALQTGRGCGVEALCRWFLTSGDSIAPAVFIPVAERAGMVGALGAYVLKAACHAAAAWKGRDAQQLTLSLNVSTLQISEEFSQMMAEILRNSGFPAQRLELEIAESALLRDDEFTNNWVTRWKQQGVRIAVSHSGDNYSNLRYLSKLHVDRLKLDKSLIHGMIGNSKTAAMVSALVALGTSLGIDVTAEGVETESQFRTLVQMGCLQAQGYLFGRPMPAAQALVVLRKPWGNLPRTMARPRLSETQRYA